MGTKVTSSSGSVLEEPEIQKLQMQAKIFKENSLNKLNALKSTTQLLERQTFSGCLLYQQAFAQLLGDQDLRTFPAITMVNERLTPTTRKRLIRVKHMIASLVIIKINGTESQEQDTSSRSGNDAHVDDAIIYPVYNEDEWLEFKRRQQENEQLLKENKTLKRHYKEMFDSIKTTRAKNIEHTTSLIANNDKFKAQIQEKGFAVAALKNELRKLTGNSVNTKPRSSMFKRRLIAADQASVFMAMTFVHISSGLVLHQMTSDHNRSELRIQDHSNEQSSSKLVPKVVP
ncbi:hypothetical protein Tco_1548776 [Tanacetum coccineum]